MVLDVKPLYSHIAHAISLWNIAAFVCAHFFRKLIMFSILFALSMANASPDKPLDIWLKDHGIGNVISGDTSQAPYFVCPSLDAAKNVIDRVNAKNSRNPSNAENRKRTELRRALRKQKCTVSRVDFTITAVHDSAEIPGDDFWDAIWTAMEAFDENGKSTAIIFDAGYTWDI